MSMPGQLVSGFLLPLLRGGALRVGRPIGESALARLGAALAHREAEGAGEGAVAALASARREVAARFLPSPPEPPLDEVSLRLGAALYDLLALGHPDLAAGTLGGLAHRQERIAAAALRFAAVGPPGSAREAVNRHSLLSRLPEIVRVDRTVTFWLGRQVFVGRTPPRRVTALPGLRRVRVERQTRGWLREIGIPVAGRGAFLALNLASPLGEALDPRRLDPPLGWGRILPLLRFPSLARVVAGSAVEQGVDRAGDALASALFRFAGRHDPPIGVPASGESVAFALRFLAHLVWLDVLFGPRVGATESGRRAGSEGPTDVGLDLAAVLTAAARTRSSLVWPADVPPDGQLGRAFRARLDEMAARAEVGATARLSAARAIAELALAPAAEPVAL